MQDRPTASELLSEVAALLEERILPEIEGPGQHQVRVAANLCRIVERELRLGPAQQEREHELMIELLAVSPDRTLTSESAEASGAELQARLAARIRQADDELFLARAHAVLLELTRAKLEVNKPGYDTYDFADEVPR